MHKKVIEFNLSQRTAKHPEVTSGDVIRVHRKIKEGDKERIQVFEGLVIRIQGRQSSSPMLTVRKQSFGVGVELMIPLYSPIVEKIEIVKKTKTRRAKLYYVREKSDRALRKKLRATTLSKVISTGAEKETAPEYTQKTDSDTPQETDVSSSAPTQEQNPSSEGDQEVKK